MPGVGRRPEMTYDVRIWAIRKVTGKQSTSYEVRWRVGHKRRSRNFGTRALAESFRADLMSAARRGEGFDVISGIPSSMAPIEEATTWWDWCLLYTSLKWPALAPGSRRGMAEALSTITSALVENEPGPPDGKKLRAAMMRHAFNVPARAKTAPEVHADSLAWLSRHSPPLSSLEDPVVVRHVLDSIAVGLSGKPVAASTVARKRAIFHNSLELAVERGLLASNLIQQIRWKAPKASEVVDMRSVVNHDQARRLLAAVGRQGDAGERLVAFFACIYYAAMRPAEATELRLSNLDLPEVGWGEIQLTASNPDVSPAWSDDGRRAARQLKHRPRGATRIIPCPPQLTAILHEHVKRYHVSANGRLFLGRYGGAVTENWYSSVWKNSRLAALTADEALTPLGVRPYQLRHAAVSTWLAAGVDSTLVANWAGHSVQVLHRVYAQVVAGRQDIALAKIERILSSPGTSDPAHNS